MSNDIELKTGDISSSKTRAHIQDSNWRSSKWLVVSELLLAVLLFIASAFHRLPLGRGPWLLALGWGSLHVRKVGWRGVGLKWYRSWVTTAAIGLGCGVLLELFELFVSQPILVRLIGKEG
jgi:hypothetical protein